MIKIHRKNDCDELCFGNKDRHAFQKVIFNTIQKSVGLSTYPVLLFNWPQIQGKMYQDTFKNISSQAMFCKLSCLFPGIQYILKSM